MEPEWIDIGETSGPPDVDANDAKRLIAAITSHDTKREWKPAEALTFGAMSWRPDAMGKKNAILHVALVENLPRYAKQRMRLAKEAGYRLHVALTENALFVPDWCELLAELDAEVYVIEELPSSKKAKAEPRHVLATIADRKVPVSPELRSKMAGHAIDQLGAGSNHVKGRRLEALLAFLFGQVTDFGVRNRNYKNSTQEIDIVLAIENHSTRTWHAPGKPLLLVEAKNRSTPADPATLSVLIQKVRTKRQSVKFAFLVSVAGFTSGIRSEYLRYSESDVAIVMIDAPTLRALAEATDLDKDLDDLVVAALMA